MKTATLVLFQLPRAKKNITMGKACKLYRTLYGYNNSSCYGRYHTRVEGMIDKINGIRLFRSAIIVKHRDVNKVTDLLSEYDAEIVKKKVFVDKEEAEQLGIK
jgi:hypothetical protein